MKKALGQTVRDLKRGVNKKVLKVPGIEQKVRILLESSLSIRVPNNQLLHNCKHLWLFLVELGFSLARGLIDYLDIVQSI